MYGFLQQNLPGFRKWTFVLIAAGLSGGVQAHSGDHDYIDQLGAFASARLQPGKKAQTDEALKSVQETVSLLAVIRDRHGSSALPAGTVCDAVELSGNSLLVRVTLPAEFKPGDLKALQIETVSAAIVHYYLEVFDLTEVRVEARIAAGDGKTAGVYEPLDYFAEKAPPLPEEVATPAGEGPAQPAPDYAKLHADTMKATAPEVKNVSGQGPVGVSGQPAGLLSGRTVYFSAGHGWTYSDPTWTLQRPLLLRMNEDYSNVDQINFFANYLFNAGATVVPMRPLGYQTNEVVLDNDSPSVTYTGTWTLSGAASDNWGTAQTNRNINAAATETATATYLPNLPAAGFYPVYCYANAGTNRVSGQLYRILHTGGESQVRVNHRRVGRGWVWLGNYYFESGSNAATGAVIISNLQPPAGTQTGVIIADAIRFGNGIGDISRFNSTSTAGISGREREAEGSCYWIANAQAPTSIVNMTAPGDDTGDTIGGPPRMAAFMRSDDGQGYNGDIYLGYHSNAAGTTARGSVGLITNSGGTPVNQNSFAALVCDELDIDCLIEDANWQHTWIDRVSSTLTSAYGEISNTNLGGEMCGTIIETAFHDNTQDAELLRDPKVRSVMARSQYHAIVKYFAQFDTVTNIGEAYLPEPPQRVRAVNNGSGGVTVSWAAVAAHATGGQAATGYKVYRSTNGFGFGNPVTAAGNSVTINGLTANQVYYFRISATNPGGESMPSEVLAVRVRASGASNVLVVNGYDRIDRLNNVPQFPANPSDDVTERLRLERNNSYDYVRQHGSAIAAAGHYFDSCSNEAVINGDITLSGYAALDWISGEESTADKTFDATERTAVQNYLGLTGKALFVSGAEIGFELDNQGVAPAFYNSFLKADYVGDDGNSYQATGSAGSILAGIVMNFPAGAGVYDADFCDTMNATGGSTVCATYTNGGSGNAAIQFSGAFKVVNFGFPFENISSSATRNQVMTAVMNYLLPVSTVEDWTIY